MRIFIDTNVLISAFTASGISRKLLYLLNEEHDILVSSQVLNEFRRVTTEKFRAVPADVNYFLGELIKNSEVILPPYLTKFPVRDPDDIDILAAALKSEADYLVTGDKDLLSVDAKGAIRIIKPRELYDLLNRETEND